MLKCKIFIGSEPQEGRLGSTGKYSYGSGTLHIFRNGEMVKKCDANVGDTYEVTFHRRTTNLKKVVWPHKKENLVAALLGFEHQQRAYSMDEYERILEKMRERYMWEGYQEWEHLTEASVFARCNKPSDKGHRNLVVFISKAIGKDEILALVPEMDMPRECALKALEERLGINL